MIVGKRIRPAAGLNISGASGYAFEEYDTDPRRVYVTTDVKLAEAFAGLHINHITRQGGGRTLYQVEPRGRIEGDPDFSHVPSLSYTCDFATILSVEKINIYLSSALDRYANSFSTWDDGSSMYDADGYMLPSPDMHQWGITATWTRQFGPEPDLMRIEAALCSYFKTNGIPHF